MNKTVSIVVILLVLAVGVWLVIGGGKEKEAGQTTDGSSTTGSTVGVSVGVSTSTPTPKEFTVVASNFAFSTSTITVNKGDVVKVTLKNTDGFHSLKIDGYNVGSRQLKAGETDTFLFVADTVGTFDFYCTVGNHRAMGMEGKLIVK